MMFKVGDRVLIKYPVWWWCYSNDTGIIISNGSFVNRFYVEKTKKLNVSGTKVKIWVSGERLSIDTQYYRDKKINELLNG